MASFPLISPIVPIWNCFVIFHSFFINYLINYSILLMIFNAILSVNHIFIIYTQFYNLLFPRRSCSIGLFSVGKYTPSSQTECSHNRPICPHLVRLVGILLNRQFRFGCLFFANHFSKIGIRTRVLASK